MRTKGGLSYSDIMNMPFNQVLNYKMHIGRIIEEENQAIKKEREK